LLSGRRQGTKTRSVHGNKPDTQERVKRPMLCYVYVFLGIAASPVASGFVTPHALQHLYIKAKSVEFGSTTNPRPD
jgi:hypothetical protein